MTDAPAAFWVQRWKRLLVPPADAELRAARLGRDLRRWQDLQVDIALADEQRAGLLEQTTISATLARGGAGGDGALSDTARRRNLACRPPAQPLLTAHTNACRTTAPDQPADPAAAARADPSPILANTAITDRGAHPRPPSPLTPEAKARRPAARVFWRRWHLASGRASSPPIAASSRRLCKRRPGRHWRPGRSRQPC